MKALLLLFVVVTGVLNTLQSGSNSTLAKTIDRPLWTVVIVFLVGLATSLALALLSGQSLPNRDDIALVPWWAWIGGMLGASYIVSLVLAADKLGAAVFMGVTVTMAVVTSLVLDHFGWLGFDVRQAGIGRIAGALLMIAGLGLIARF